jgi:hypothetical protein
MRETSSNRDPACCTGVNLVNRLFSFAIGEIAFTADDAVPSTEPPRPARAAIGRAR